MRAIPLKRAPLAQRLGAAAKLLTVATKEKMRLDQSRDVQLARAGLLHEAVRCGVALLLLAESQTQERAQPVGLKCKHRMRPREEKNLLRPRLADGGKPLQGFLGLGERPLENGAKIAVKFL